MGRAPVGRVGRGGGWRHGRGDDEWRCGGAGARVCAIATCAGAAFYRRGEHVAIAERGGSGGRDVWARVGFVHLRGGR